LIEIGAPKAELLKTDKGVLTDAEFAAMHTWQDPEDRKILRGWINCLRKYGVFFSEPLDLDLAMLAAFPTAYSATIPNGGGPKMAADKAADAVLGASGPGLTLYTGPYKDYPQLFPTYRYHFLAQSKPATHLAALTYIKNSELKLGMPSTLADVLAHIAKNLRRG
jgi:putative ATP-dependent endonuclease of OLD family